MSDFYAGQDLLADVFPGTADAPLPTPHLSPVDGRVLRLAVAPTDPRWSVTNGYAQFARSIEPRSSDRLEPVQGSPSTNPGGFVGVRTQREAANGNGGEA